MVRFRFSFLVFLVAQLSAAQDDACGAHEDCQDGHFCAMSTCSSFEGLTGSTGGWTFPCPTCKPCAECICNIDSVTGLCPRDLCPGSPTLGVPALEGTFVATSSLRGGDICLTSLTVHATFFRMVSFRVDKTTYARSQRPHPQQVTGQFAGALQSGGPSLCEFPDAPGAMEGRITVLPPTDPDMIAKLRLTYVDGLPLGVTRIVNIYDSCPVGLLARFEPVMWVPIAYNDVLGLNPPGGRYTYFSGDSRVEWNRHFWPGISGYKFNEINQAQAEGVASIVLEGPAENTRELTTIGLTSAYSGFFEFGTTRKSENDLGDYPALICNVTFLFESGMQGANYWDQYTWGCKVRTPLASAPAALPSPGQKRFGPKEEGVFGAWRSPQSSHEKIDKGGLEKEQWLGTLSGKSTEHARKLLEAACPAGSFMDTARPDKCNECPEGHYQPAMRQTVCLACPNGFVNNMNGSTSVGDCCVQQHDVGLYNEQKLTSYNYFGYENGKISGIYYSCPNEEPCPQGQLCPGGQSSLSSPLWNLKRCTKVEQHISRPADCPATAVQFTVLPKLDNTPINGVFGLELGRVCEMPNAEGGCYFDLGLHDSVNISMFTVGKDTQIPEELKYYPTRLPSEDLRPMPVKSEQLLDYSKDLNLPLFHFSSTNQPYQNSSNSSKPESPESSMFYLSPQISTNVLLLSQQQADKSWSCSYENTGNLPERGDVSFWFVGERNVISESPQCGNDYSQRLEFLDKLASDGYNSILKGIGLRVIAKVGTAPSRGFRIGYRFFPARKQCPPGFSASLAQYISQDIDDVCTRCPLGTFAPTFQSSTCFLCPKGTYANQTGSSRCWPCPTGHSTVGQGATSPTLCKPYCRSGMFSGTGLQPCEACPRDTVQDRIGETSCYPCPPNSLTLSETGKGFTNVAPWRCTPRDGLSFFIEKYERRGQSITFTITWKIPEKNETVHVKDLIVLGKGNNARVRQLAWAFASAASTEATDNTCISGLSGPDACRSPGLQPKPWASIKLTSAISGQGIYTAGYYSYSKGMMILTDTKDCPKQDCSTDTAAWETDTGLYVCKPGQFSRTDGSGPCYPCPTGTVSMNYSSTTCMKCPQGYGSFPLLSNPQQKYNLLSGIFNEAMVGGSTCKICPDGTTTATSGMGFDQCFTCEYLTVQKKSNPTLDISFCTGVQTTMAIMTTPAPGICGDGIRRPDVGEACDDNNTNPNDGCTPDCKIEPNWQCERVKDLPDRCYLLCGDGRVDGDEKCDDRNDKNGDGCSSGCRIENGWGCDCAPYCSGYLCTLKGTCKGKQTTCAVLPECGNGIRELPYEECDDGGVTSGDGCNEKCIIETGFKCDVDFPDVCCATLQLCGDGFKQQCEGCDDGNRKSNDGCSAQCEQEKLFICRDGCSGPLCHSDQKCTDSLIGEKRQKKDLDVLDWFGVDRAFEEKNSRKPGEYGVGSSEEYSFLVQDTWCSPDKCPPGTKDDPLVSVSSGIFFEQKAGPLNTGIFQMFTADLSNNEIGADMKSITKSNMMFTGSYGLGSAGTDVQLGCMFCSGKINMDWPWGTISEPRGMMAKDRDCEFGLNAGSNQILDVQTLDRMMIVTFHEMDLDSEETLTLRLDTYGGNGGIVQQSQGVIVQEGFYTYYGLAASSQALKLHLPFEVHLPISQILKCYMTYRARSHLYNASTSWDPVLEGVRFKVTYESVVLTTEGKSCQELCKRENGYDLGCLKTRECAKKSRAIRLDGLQAVTDLSPRSNKSWIHRRDINTYSKDYNNSNFQLRNIALSQQDWQGNKKEIVPSIRNNVAGSDIIADSDAQQVTNLRMSLSGYQGRNQNPPCTFAQDSQQLLLTVSKHSMTSALGLTWKDVGSVKPSTGTEIKNELLAAALQRTVEFNKEQWKTFRVAALSSHSYIKAGGYYFKPVGSVDGVWTGTCQKQLACGDPDLRDETETQPCIRDEDYKNYVNTCLVHIEVDDNVIREYRYNCNNTGTIAGVSHGVIVSMDDAEVRTDPQTNVRYLIYRPFVVIWTKSTFANTDRPLGVKIKAFLTFGSQSSHSGNMQILLGSFTGRGSDSPPLDKYNRLSERFEARYGMCKNLDLMQAKDLNVKLSSPGGGQGKSQIVSIIHDLDLYKACNKTFQDIQRLERTSAECNIVVRTLLYRNIKSEFILPKGMAAEICKYPCFQQAQQLLMSSVNTCGKIWKESEFQFGTTFKYRIFKKLYLAVAASAYSSLMCLINHRGDRCIKSTSDFGEIFKGCPKFSVSTNIFKFIAAPFCSTGNDVACPGFCRQALDRYEQEYGCCGPSVSSVAETLSAFLMNEGDAPFQLDLGFTTNPWTDVGSGKGETYGISNECQLNNSESIFPRIMAISGTHCNRPKSWCKECCVSTCLNGGTKSYPGACFCSCPLGWSGDICQNSRNYVLADLVFSSETLEEFSCLKVNWVLEGIVQLLNSPAVTISEAELDTIENFVGLRRVTSVRMVIRVLSNTVRETQRLSQILVGGFQPPKRASVDGNNLLAAAIRDISGTTWPMAIIPGKYLPMPMDGAGRELCDEKSIKCQLIKSIPKQDEGPVSSAAVAEISNTNTMSTETLMRILVAVLASVIFVILVAICCRWGPTCLRRIPVRQRKMKGLEVNAEKKRYTYADEFRSVGAALPTSGMNVRKLTGNDNIHVESGDKALEMTTKPWGPGDKIFSAVEFEDASKPPTKTETDEVMGKLYEVPEKKNFKYDPNKLEEGFRDVDAQRALILYRLKVLQKQQKKGNSEPSPLAPVYDSVVDINMPVLITDRNTKDVKSTSQSKGSSWKEAAAYRPGADNDLAWRRLVASGGCNIVPAKEASESASLMHLHASNASSQHTQEWSRSLYASSGGDGTGNPAAGNPSEQKSFQRNAFKKSQQPPSFRSVDEILGKAQSVDEILRKAKPDDICHDITI